MKTFEELNKKLISSPKSPDFGDFILNRQHPKKLTGKPITPNEMSNELEKKELYDELSLSIQEFRRSTFHKKVCCFGLNQCL